MSRVVLVVDDALSVLEVTIMMVENLGCIVLAASSGKEALGMLSQRHVDILIADIDMPGMKGTDLAQQATERWPHLGSLGDWRSQRRAGLHRVEKAVWPGKIKARNGGDNRAVLKRQGGPLFVRGAQRLSGLRARAHSSALPIR